MVNKGLIVSRDREYKGHDERRLKKAAESDQ